MSIEYEYHLGYYEAIRNVSMVFMDVARYVGNDEDAFSKWLSSELVDAKRIRDSWEVVE